MMRLLFILLCPVLALGQVHDSLFVSEDKTVYLLFDADVDFVNIGSDAYDYEMAKNMVMVGSLKPKVQTTSMMVKTKSGEVFVWHLSYRHNPPRLLVDTRLNANGISSRKQGQINDVVASSTSKNSYVNNSVSSTTNNNPAPGPTTNYQLSEEKRFSSATAPKYIQERERDLNREYEVPDNILQNKFYHILNQKKAIRDVGEIDNSIYFMLDDIFVDRKYIYIKISIHNSSSIAFDVDFLSFERSQGKNMKRREGNSRQPLDLMYKESVKTINPSKEEILVYAISLFAFEDNDSVLVKLSELGGVRTMNFSIPAKLITNAKTL